MWLSTFELSLVDPHCIALLDLLSELGADPLELLGVFARAYLQLTGACFRQILCAFHSANTQHCSARSIAQQPDSATAFNQRTDHRDEDDGHRAKRKGHRDEGRGEGHRDEGKGRVLMSCYPIESIAAAMKPTNFSLIDLAAHSRVSTADMV